MYILEVLAGLWHAMLQLFWFGHRSISNKFSVFIKSSTGDTVTVNLDPKWDIKCVKEMVAPKLGMPPEEVKIILAGKELDDSVVIEECDLGEMSILHAVRSQSTAQRSRKPLNEVLTELTLTEEEEPVTDVPNKANFYVYCSAPCGKLTSGKLRVRCATCKSGAITVDSDPASWAQVLTPQSISGCCETDGCPAGAVAWAEFYLKCSEHRSCGESDEAVALHLIRTNYRNVPCIACMDVCDVVLVFHCNHVTCLGCFTQYCISRLQERRFVLDPTLGYTLACPANCSDSLITEVHHFKLLPKDLYIRYQRFGTEDYVLKNGGVLCPQPNCGAGIILDDECTDKITCINGCGFVFCRKCLQGYHLGECDEIEEHQSSTPGYSFSQDNVDQARWDEASKKKIKITTKPCPKCRTATERSGGCMHMVCLRCSLEWCWVCQTTWTRDCMGNHWFG